MDTQAAVAATPVSIVEGFKDALGAGAIPAARAFLADDLHFAGPLEEFHTADDYIGALTRLVKIVTGIDNVKLFADGEHVAVVYDLLTNTPAGASPTAELYRVRGGKITEIRAIFDARPFAAMFQAESANR